MSKSKIDSKYLFWAPLIFSFLCFVQLPSDETASLGGLESSASFLVSYLAGSLLVYLIGLCPALATRKNPPALFCLLPAIVGLILVFLYHEARFGFIYQVPLGASLIGASSALLFLSWGRALTVLSSRQFSLTLIACFTLAALLKLLFAPLLTTTFNLVVLGIAIVVSAFPLDSINNEKLPPQKNSVLPEKMRLKDTSLKLFEPAFGMILCCMIWGFTWGNAIQDVPLASSEFDFSDLFRNIGGFIACIAIFLLVWKKGFDPSHGFLPALAVGILLGDWIILDTFPPVSIALSSTLSGACFFAIDISLWCKLTELGHHSKERAWRLVCIVRAILMSVILVSIAITPILGPVGAELATPLLSIVFFILISSVTLWKTASVRSGRPSEETAQSDALPSEFDLEISFFQAHYDLSSRETEVLTYFVKGHSSKFISEQLFISQHTVKTHIKRIYDKAKVHSKDDLIKLFHDLYESQF